MLHMKKRLNNHEQRLSHVSCQPWQRRSHWFKLKSASTRNFVKKNWIYKNFTSWTLAARYNSLNLTQPSGLQDLAKRNRLPNEKVLKHYPLIAKESQIMPYREGSRWFLNTNYSSSVFLDPSSKIIDCKVLRIKSYILPLRKRHWWSTK